MRFEALKEKPRGPKRDRVADENRRLREQIARPEERLGTAEELISAQGNAFALSRRMSRESDEVP